MKTVLILLLILLALLLALGFFLASFSMKIRRQSLEEARACVAIDQGTPNAGHMLWVSGSGEVTSEVPTQIMLMDSARTKTFVLTIGTEGALTVSEVVA